MNHMPVFWSCGNSVMTPSVEALLRVLATVDGTTCNTCWQHDCPPPLVFFFNMSYCTTYKYTIDNAIELRHHHGSMIYFNEGPWAWNLGSVRRIHHFRHDLITIHIDSK